MKFGNSRVMEMSEACSALETARFQLYDPPPLHPARISEGRDDRDGVRAIHVWNLQDLSDRSAGVVSALEQIQSLFQPFYARKHCSFESASVLAWVR